MTIADSNSDDPGPDSGRPRDGEPPVTSGGPGESTSPAARDQASPRFERLRQLVRMRRIGRRIERALARRLPEKARLNIYAALIGVLAALLAVAFHHTTAAVQGLAYGPGPLSLSAPTMSPWLRLLAPALGGWLCGLVLARWLKGVSGHGLPEVMDALDRRGGLIPARVAPGRLVAASLTIGSGGSAGTEGPVAQIGAAIGSTVAARLGLPRESVKVLLACGAAAGVSAAFNTPLAGVLFVVEILLGSGALHVFTPLVVASIVATMISRGLGDGEPFFAADNLVIGSAAEYPVFLLLGLAAGRLSVWLIRGLDAAERLWARLAVTLPTRIALGGLCAGAVGLLDPRVLGGGVEVVNLALAGKLTLAGCVLLLPLKALATSCTLGSGGSGGAFMPTIILGALLGSIFGLILNLAFPGHVSPPGTWVLVGMGAVVAGTTHAPVTAILILFELTSDYNVILPLMLCCAISVTLSSHLWPNSLYGQKLARLGLRRGVGADAEILAATSVAGLIRPASTVTADAPFDRIVRRLCDERSDHVYVVDDEGTLLGLITLEDLKHWIGDDGLRDLAVAVDLMAPVATALSPSDDLVTACDAFAHSDRTALPVLEDGRLAGELNEHQLLVVYDRDLLHRRGRGLEFVRSDLRTFVELAPDHSIARLPLPGWCAGHSLAALDLRRRYGVTVLSIERRRAGSDEVRSIDPDEPLERGVTAVVTGSTTALAAFAAGAAETESAAPAELDRELAQRLMASVRRRSGADTSGAGAGDEADDDTDDERDDGAG